MMHEMALCCAADDVRIISISVAFEIQHTYHIDFFRRFDILSFNSMCCNFVCSVLSIVSCLLFKRVICRKSSCDQLCTLLY